VGPRTGVDTEVAGFEPQTAYVADVLTFQVHPICYIMKRPPRRKDSGADHASLRQLHASVALLPSAPTGCEFRWAWGSTSINQCTCTDASRLIWVMQRLSKLVYSSRRCETCDIEQLQEMQRLEFVNFYVFNKFSFKSRSSIYRLSACTLHNRGLSKVFLWKHDACCHFTAQCLVLFPAHLRLACK
jgi:hypothetical protein